PHITARITVHAAAAARAGQIHYRAEVGVVGDATGDPGCTDRHHVGAAGRTEVGRVGGRVAGRDHHGRAPRDGTVDRILVQRIARAAAAQAHVDDLGRIGIGRHTGDSATGGPGDRV